MEELVRIGLEIAIPLLNLFVVRDYLNSFLHLKATSTKRKQVLVWSTYLVIDIVIGSIIPDAFLRLAYNFLLWFLLCLALYRSKIKHIVIIVIAYECLVALIEGLILVCLLNLGVPLSATYGSYLGWTLSRVVLIMVNRILKIWKDKKNGETVPASYWIAVIYIPLSIGFVLLQLFPLLLGLRKEYEFVDTAIIMLVLLVNTFLTFYIYEALGESEIVKRENSMYSQQVEALQAYNQERELIWADMRRFRHDSKNHLLCLKEYCANNQIDKMENYLNALIDSQYGDRHGDEVKTGNSSVDALLNAKLAVMRQDKITLEHRIEIPSQIAVADIDIAIILGNLLDNAIEAVRELEPEHRRVELIMEYRKGNLLLKISNPYAGVRKRSGQGFVTTKAEKRNHGIGLMSVRKTVEKYQGLLQLEAKESVFQTRVLLYCSEMKADC